MCHVLEAKERLEFVDFCLISAGENLVDMCDDGLDVCRTVLRHELADRLEITPVVAGLSIVSITALRVWS